ncbi:MAG: DUF1801 domain-containing protein [Anaerolineales bacterium]|nr:DUF1801 domain-containing protein [Anaerolineales bacterium]
MRPICKATPQQSQNISTRFRKRAALTKIRELCQEHLAEFEESMQYGMPSYSRDGTVEVAFASQKNNISLYILRTDVLNPYRG